MISANNFLLVLNSSVNFIIYCLVEESFRAELLSILTSWFLGLWKIISMLYHFVSPSYHRWKLEYMLWIFQTVILWKSLVSCATNFFFLYDIGVMVLYWLCVKNLAFDWLKETFDITCNFRYVTSKRSVYWLLLENWTIFYGFSNPFLCLFWGQKRGMLCNQFY